MNIDTMLTNLNEMLDEIHVITPKDDDAHDAQANAANSIQDAIDSLIYLQAHNDK